MLTWTECHIASANHARSVAKADAIGWMWPRRATRPLRVRLTAALVARGLRQAPPMDVAARGHTTSLSA